MNGFRLACLTALAVMLAVGISGCFLPHRLPDWYRILVAGLALMIFGVLNEMGCRRPGGTL